MARLASGLWVQAYLARLRVEGIFCHVARKGEPTAGAIAVKLATMDGRATLFVRGLGPEGDARWLALDDGAAERAVDARLDRMIARDRDLWAIEVEDPRGRHLLDQEGLT